MSQSDDPGTGSTPHGSTPSGWAAPSSASGGDQQSRPSYGDRSTDSPRTGSPAGQPPTGSRRPVSPYGQSPYGQAPYGQTPYGQPSYGSPAYGGQYGQPAYGAPSAYGQYGYSAAPSRPAVVIVAAILGFVFAAFGVLATLGVFLGGAAVVGMAGALDSGALGAEDPFAGDLAGDAAAGIGIAFVVIGLLALTWTVLMIWGSVWVLTGRSRVLLLVGGSIAVLVTLIGVLGSVLDSTTASGNSSEYAIGIVLTLVFFVASLAIVVPLCLRPATQFFAAHRARRGR